jgi:hypothetical protein
MMGMRISSISAGRSVVVAFSCESTNIVAPNSLPQFEALELRNELFVDVESISRENVGRYYSGTS